MFSHAPRVFCLVRKSVNIFCCTQNVGINMLSDWGKFNQFFLLMGKITCDALSKTYFHNALWLIYSCRSMNFSWLCYRVCQTRGVDVRRGFVWLSSLLEDVKEIRLCKDKSFTRWIYMKVEFPLKRHWPCRFTQRDWFRLREHKTTAE